MINSDEENAFITLDENIYITKGLIERLDTEEELLAVFAHELGHAQYRHIEKEYEKNEKMQKEGVNRVAKYLVRNEYSKECEFQADSFGVEALLKLGRDPAGLRGLFGKFKDDEDKQWNEFRESLLKPDESKMPAPVIEKSREEKEKKADETVRTVKTLERFTRTHPYASERLERASTQINDEIDKGRAYSSSSKKCRIDEEGFIHGLTGTFDEKLAKLKERYPDGRAGRTDDDAQVSLFKYGTMDWNVGDFGDDRSFKLNLFATHHAASIEDFKKIFAEQKVLNGADVTAYLSRMTDGKADRAGETAKLWSVDFANNFLAYGYPDFEQYGTEHETHVTRTPYKESKIKAKPDEQYTWSKRFCFRNFAKEHLYTEVKTRDDLRRMLDLPFMAMDEISIIPAEKFPSLAGSVHNKGIFDLAMQVYKNETGRDTIDGSLLTFMADIFKGRLVGSSVFEAMHEGLVEWYKDLEKNGGTDDFYRSLRDFAGSFPSSEDQENISGNIVRPALHSIKADNFERRYCSIFTRESKKRDDVLADKILWDFTADHVRSSLPYFTASKRKNIAKILKDGNKDLTFSQRTSIFKEFFPLKDVHDGYEAMNLSHRLTQLCRIHGHNAEEIADVFRQYETLTKKCGIRRFNYMDPRGMVRLTHPLHLRADFGNDFAKHIDVTVALLNCGQLVPGIYSVLKIADTAARSTADIDKSFSSLQKLTGEACMLDFDNKWNQILESVLDHGMKFSATEHGGDFDRIFADLDKWSYEMKMGAEHSRIPALFGELDPLLENRMVLSLKRYGRDAEDAVKVINTIKRRREADKDSKSVIDKAIKLKEELEIGYDKSLVMAGFTGYFLQKKAGKLPADLDEHLNFIKALMPEPTPPRDAIVREFMERDGLTPDEKVRIAGFLSDFKEKSEVQSKLYDTAVKALEKYDELPYREKIDLVKKHFAEPSRVRDRILTDIEKKYAQSVGETKHSGALKFDRTKEPERKESTYVRNNKYLLDPEKRAQAIAALSAGTLTKILLRYFSGPQEKDKETSEEERRLYDTVGKLEPVDRKRIIKEMLVGLDAFEDKHLKDLDTDNRTGAFSIKAWKKEFINTVIDSVFKKGAGASDDDFSLWLIRQIFNEASVDRSADIISELIEAQKGDLTSEQLMFRFLKAGGPITRKLGQILSSNSMVPEKYQKEFANLKLAEDSPIEKEQIIRIIKSDLDGRVGEGIGGIHVDYIGKLLGSASIRTVYRVTIHGNDYVAKINDPKARAMALDDLKLLDEVSKKLEASPELKKEFGLENPRLMLHNLTLSLFQDIDSRIELINSRKLEKIIHQEGNHASKIFFAGPNVVLEECVEGKGIHKAIEKFSLNKKQVVDRILEAYAAQIDKGIFHADPHSENIMLSKTGEVYWIDKSMQGDFTIDDFSRGEKKAIFDILFDIGVFGHVDRLHNRASKLIMKHLDEMARIQPGSTAEKENVRSEIHEILNDETKGAADKFYAIEQAAEKHGYVFSDNVFMLGKSMLTLSGEIKKIDPEAEIGDHLKMVFLKDMGRRAAGRIRNFFTGADHGEKKGFLQEKGISSLSTIDWNAMKSRNLISDSLASHGIDEFKEVKSEEDAIGKLKYMFLKYGDELSVDDIYFLMNALKSTEALKALQRKIPSGTL